MGEADGGGTQSVLREDDRCATSKARQSRNRRQSELLSKVKKVVVDAVENHGNDLRARREAIFEAKRGLLRCPACFLVKDATQGGFTCGLSRCPRVFANIEPPTGSQPAADMRGKMDQEDRRDNHVAPGNK
jgi:hypothetical protein